jgi:hypothetical protein
MGFELRSASVLGFEEWIQLVDAGGDEPALWVKQAGLLSDSTREGEYLFNVRVSNDNNTDVYFSNFIVHLYRCYTENCANCSFGTVDTEVCYACKAGYWGN